MAVDLERGQQIWLPGEADFVVLDSDPAPAVADGGRGVLQSDCPPLVPYSHQNQAVYGAMLPQPVRRFLLADARIGGSPPRVG